MGVNHLSSIGLQSLNDLNQCSGIFVSILTSLRIVHVNLLRMLYTLGIVYIIYYNIFNCMFIDAQPSDSFVYPVAEKDITKVREELKKRGKGAKERRERKS